MTARSLATVLFTDIVGSTERAAELRDAGWRDLRQEHDKRVRRELRRFGGREINTAGDSFLATFERPARAIACAGAIRAAVRELGLEIRAGLHMGELEGARRDPGGLALNIGARVAAEAGPGEILVSRSVHDALAGSALDFEDRGVRTLKGVPGEWRLFAVTSVPAEADEPLPSRLMRTLIRRRVLVASAAVGVVLVGLLGLRVAQRDGAAPPVENLLAANSAPGIAVAPFAVNDPDLNLLREGMVDLLSTNLDGVGGLRAISSRTVLARWGESVGEYSNPDLATILAVTGRTGARYAVVGSAVGIGPEVRLTGDVFDIRTQQSLGSARVQGPMENVWTLVDRFSIEIVKAILGTEKDAPRVRGLAAVTTDSLAALRAYLEGQQLYRRADFIAAARAYARAIEIDTTFALADLELARACGWILGDLQVCELAGERTRQFVDSLPEREAAYARASVLYESASLEVLDLLRANVRRYPDDPQAWYELGDAYYHLDSQALVDPEEDRRALTHSVQLAPGAAPLEAYLHLLDLAWRAADSTQIAHWLDQARKYAPSNDLLNAHRHAFMVAFGDSARAARARAEIRALEPVYAAVPAGDLSVHPRFLPLGTELFEELLNRQDIDERTAPFNAFFLVSNLIAAGRLRSALARLGHDPAPLPRARAALAYELHQIGMKLPEEGIRSWLSVDQAVDDCLQCLFYAGAYAADLSRWADHRHAVETLRHRGRIGHFSERFGFTAAGGEVDSVIARYHQDAARALEGYALWKQGRVKEAEQILESQRQRIVGGSFQAGSLNWTIRGWLGQIAVERGRWEEAARYFRSIDSASAEFALGRVYTELGEYEKARESYEYALLAWRGADPELQSQIETASRALVRLPRPLKRESP